MVKQKDKKKTKKKKKKNAIRYHSNRIIIIFAQAKPKLCNAEPTQPLYT